jgi:predicted molibdopterin-dependent oxidoreductase YjgC
VEATVSDRTGDGVVFLPFHYAEAAANLLTSADATDPESRIPEFKATAVRIELLDTAAVAPASVRDEKTGSAG